MLYCYQRAAVGLFQFPKKHAEDSMLFMSVFCCFGLILATYDRRSLNESSRCVKIMQTEFLKIKYFSSMIQVKENNTVKVNYTGKLSDGQVFDSSEGREPLEFTLGQGQLIPGFEKGVIDMKLNEKKTITIAKEEAYGDINKELIQEVDKAHLPQDMAPEVGMGLVSKDPDGREINLLVTEVKEESIVVDGNHPLAGKELTFDLEVVEIKETEITK
ncbi:MAG: FKBP-type peptidyl-prolyl cis-trans isomerase 2 [Glaciecola sp.]|jgi:FKBP-type peptidyl-prolyl cis-trans isomerase 2